MNTIRGTLYVVAAPSGAGKSSLVNAVLAKEPGIALSISFTSRAPRPGERHAQHYHFVDKAEFERMIAADQTAATFPLDGYWIDIGRLEDLERARAEAPAEDQP